jgi:hypothetical protein
MILLTAARRRTARNMARLGVAFSAVMLVISGVALFGSGQHATAAADLLGAVQFRTAEGVTTITGGGSATVFAMVPPTGAACPGSGSGTPSYRWHTYIVSDSVDVGALTYGGSGPNPVSGAFVSAMYDGGETPVFNQNPAASPLGQITTIPTFSLGVFLPPAGLAAGTYKVGFACSTGGATVSYWTSQIVVVADTNDAPGGFTWTVSTAPPTSTTTSTTSTTSTVPGSTTTTIPKATTTTTSTTIAATSTTSTTTTTIAVGSASNSNSNSSGSGSLAPSGSGIPVTGASPIPFVIWAILLLVFGRMAILLARPLRVLPPTSR